MAKETKEPQGYGSGPDWVEGNTGGQIHDPKARPAPEHREFYDESSSSEPTEPDDGGHPSQVQMEERDEAGGRAAADTLEPATKVTTSEGGAKRDSYFKRRDYE
ncbi:MAG TPA: hypothetical protein VF701_12715 [Thermoanaerobaculia bacterium]